MIKEYTYDEIYGVNLGEYLKLHSKTKKQLENEIKKDIEILELNLKKQVWDAYEVDWVLVGEIVKLLNKKQKHLKRIKNWKGE